MSTSKSLSLVRAAAAALVLPLLSGCMMTVVDEPAYVDGPAMIDSYRTDLAPYGEWIADPTYGWVWRPSAAIVGDDFEPYATGGHWVYSDWGWSFEADYDFAPIVFHYGRWFRHDHYGWIWVPDTEWAPAWVEWRVGAGYIGWVPLGPPSIVVEESHWVFVHEHEFTRPHVVAHAVPRESIHDAYRVTATPARGSHAYPRGPERGHVERVTGSPVPRVHTPPRAPRVTPRRRR